MATFGGWDEARHERQFGECLNRGGISIIELDGARVGMIQLFNQPDAVEVGEIDTAKSPKPGDWQPRFARYDCSSPRAAEEGVTFCGKIGMISSRSFNPLRLALAVVRPLHL